MATATTITTVECHKQVRSWRLLRSLVQLLIPTCNCTFPQDPHHDLNSQNYPHNYNNIIHLPPIAFTGTIFGYRRRGKVKFCIQPNPQSTNPILLLELPVPTSILAKEMRGGTLRMALQSTATSTSGSTSTYCSSNNNNNNNNNNNLLSTPLWSMHCNGRKMGYAAKRAPSSADLEALRAMRSVVVGAGVVNDEDEDDDDELMYLRAKFQRVRGSSNSESFHLIDPEGTIGQELSIFFFRST